jgi:hypothetical protein
MAFAATMSDLGGNALPRLRFAKPAKRPVETIETREILHWSLQWPAVAEGDDPRYEPVLGAWKVRIS